MTEKLPLKPVGQRPTCQWCAKELKPNFEYQYPPFGKDERTEWRKANPPRFLGTYGPYGDNLFCGLNCARLWAIRSLMASTYGGNEGVKKLAERVEKQGGDAMSYTVTQQGETMEVLATCLECKTTTRLSIPSAQWKAWKNGAHIQDAMPQVSIDDRELLISGVCGTCFDKMFPDDDED